MFSLDQVISWAQTFAISVITLYSMYFIVTRFIMRQAVIEGLIGIVVIGFAAVFVLQPEAIWAAGRWLYDAISWG